MKKNHSAIWLGFAVFFAAAVYSMLLFILKPRLDATAWVLYGATMLAFLLMGVQVITAARGDGVVLNSVQNIVTEVYFALQFVFGGIICQCFSGLPFIPAIVFEVLLLVVYLVISFVIFATQNNNAAQKRNALDALRVQRSLESDVLSMMSQQTDPDLQKTLKELAEAIHFCDVSDHQNVAEFDRRIAEDVAILRDELKDEEAEPLRRIAEIRGMIDERNRMAAILKQ